MRHVLILLVVLVWSSELMAQAPGFVGRRFILSAAMDFTPATLRLNARDKSWFAADEFSFAFNRQLNLQAEYALNRRVSLRGGVYFPRTGFDFSISNPGITGGRDEHDIFYRVQGFMMSAMATYYNVSNWGSIAPKGRYSSWGIEYGVIRGVEANRNSTYANPAAVVQAPVPIDPRRSTLAFLLGFGNNLFLTDRVFLKGEITFRLIPFGGVYSDFGQTSQQRFQEELGRRLFLHSFIMMQVGAGVALF